MGKEHGTAQVRGEGGWLGPGNAPQLGTIHADDAAPLPWSPASSHLLQVAIES